MEICRKKTDAEYYICLEENIKHITLITPLGQTKCLVRNAFDDPTEIDTSSESNLRQEISRFGLPEIQVISYRDYLLQIMGSMLDFEESEPFSPEKIDEKSEIAKFSDEELIISYEKVIPIIKILLHRKRRTALRMRRVL